MPPKPPLDKQCWKWAESTEPGDVTRDNIRTAYRLNLPMCRLGQCKRQCKGNPHCLNCIGEKVWFGEIQDTTWHDVRDPEEERRDPDMFVGLKNLGATCYVNTFLQLWFHNDKVKQGIYKWRPLADAEDTSDDWKPSSVCSHLQVIFGLLELSHRRYVDPSAFIQHLGLDAGQQQDAQEFSKLFLNVLEENLVQNNTPSPRNIIKEQFCGSYAYVTRCSSCRSASERESEFYELDLNIQGHKTLDDSLKAFLEVEKLEGDNQYMCDNCNKKQNATRAIELKRLPPVLNLQLLRFVFEIKTGSKKKLNSIIQFPDTLDMGEHLPAGRCSLLSKESAIYDLTAVLIHRGPSAYSGHFVAHIKGKDSQAWYKFNDEEIEKIKGRNLKLGNEEDLEVKQKKSVRTPKGFHSSKNAYMLVYTRQTGSDSSFNPETQDQTNNSIPVPDETQAEAAPVFKVEEASSVQPQVNDYLIDNDVALDLTINSKYKEEKPYEKSLLVEPATKPASPRKTHSPSPKKSPKKSEPVIHSKSEVQAQKATPTSQLRSQSLQDCATPATATNSNSADPPINKLDIPEEVGKKSAKDEKDLDLLPKYVIDYVEKDNDTFENWVVEMMEMKNKNIATGREKQETVKAIFQDLVLRDSSDHQAFEWLPMSWLSKWLNDPNSASPIDITRFLCSHGKICPEQSVKMKCVSESGVTQLCNIYGGGARRCGEEGSLCSECVKNKCNLIRTKIQIAEDDKLVTKEMKSGLVGKKCYWVGKGSFRSWRRLAMERLGDAMEDCGDEGNAANTTANCNGNSGEIISPLLPSQMAELGGVGSDENDALSGNKAIETVAENKTKPTVKPNGEDGDKDDKEKGDNDKASKEKADDDDDEDETLQFNEDLLCDAHSGLDPDVSCRRLIPEAVWTTLKKYFPGCPEFDDVAETCKDCQSCREQENEVKMLNKQAAAQQKSALADLFHDRKRPTQVPVATSLFVVSTPFVTAWRQFVRDPIRVEPVPMITNELLLCQHAGYLFLVPADNMLKSDENVTYVLAEEWKKLKDLYAVDHEIEIVTIVDNDKREVITIPAVCEECVQTRLSLEESEIFDYDNAILYVRKQQKVEAEQLIDNLKEDSPETDSKVSTNGRKRTMSGNTSSEEPPEKMVKSFENGKTVRKSQRHRRARGEKEVTMSSKSTLKDLKVQIMRLFSVPPFDQNLYVKGRKLGEDNASSLGDLRIAPGTVIDLVADEVEGDPVILDELHIKESGVPESGFKGTNLLSS